MTNLSTLRQTIRENQYRDKTEVIRAMTGRHGLSPSERAAASNAAADLVRAIRTDSAPGLMEVLLAEYGLSTDEGVALMCLAEALLRVPDTETIDALIEDKIAPSAWGQHLGQSSSSLVNASTWALMLTGKVLQEGDGIAATLRGAIRRLGEPIIRLAVGRAMKEMGAQFVLGESIEEAVERGKKRQSEGYTYSYDMLGEAALTAQAAGAYFDAYAHAIDVLANQCVSDDVRANAGISIKLSALHPRYEVSQRQRVMDELVPITLELAQRAKAAGMGLNIDAEEADRLDLSLDVIEVVLADPSLKGWDGFGVVIQSYGKRAASVIDWVYALATRLDRRLMVRLVKGAYWDSEIKRAQVEGLAGFPVFTRKAATDISYLCCAKQLLGMTDRLYPQFATHNAHTVAAILEVADDPSFFEFQRLHGMGERLHDLIRQRHGTLCRIYAPVGEHRDLLAYLVRRLLENGANSSFVNQIVDDTVSAETIATDPFDAFARHDQQLIVKKPSDLFGAERTNSRGWDLHDIDDLAAIEKARSGHRDREWAAGPIVAGTVIGGKAIDVINPAVPGDLVGSVALPNSDDVETAIAQADIWAEDGKTRASILLRAADAYEAAFGEFFAVLTREAGKTPRDAIAELREAVDFLRYYAARGCELDQPPCGVIACVSPWNFPLAIFTGQIAAALAAGNGVIAKPAEQTAITASIAVRLLQGAGVPIHALQLLPGPGPVIGHALTSDRRVSGVCFTGSTQTAQTINRAMAENLAPDAPFIAETGGLNAMIVDSTALPERAVQDIVTSAFQSAGQRCSALRILYVQEDVADTLLDMLFGAMDELTIDDPWGFHTDIGPVIDAEAMAGIGSYIEAARRRGDVLKELSVPPDGTFIAPTVLKVGGIADLDCEVFGPVLHVATFAASALDDVVGAINASGFGLTFGMHSRIDDRVEQVTARLNVGNMYVNRNQIGAVVGSQPFGGEGLSGTGPKAGGPSYVRRFARSATSTVAVEPAREADSAQVQALIDAVSKPARNALVRRELPGPTGESNMLSLHGRGVILCLGPSLEAAQAQAEVVRAHGCLPVIVAPGATESDAVAGHLRPDAFGTLTGFDGVVSWAPDDVLRKLRIALARRDGPIVPLIVEEDFGERCLLERHLCIDTTAAGGNAALLAEAS